MKNYEGMFLFDPAVLTDWDAVQKEVTRLLDRAGAEIVACSRWDERRLAYEIKGRKRGIYALTYFKADPAKIVSIERDVTLSETALRCLIVRVEHMTDEEMKEAASSTRIEQQKSLPIDPDTGEEQGSYGPRRPRRDEPVAPIEAVPEE